MHGRPDREDGHRSPTRRRWPEAIGLAVVVVLSTAFFFRRQVLNGWTVLFGNSFDAVISAAIEEHWLGVLRGEQVWNRPPWFAPHADTLGYNDGLLLFAPPYAMLRLLGCDPFLSVELVDLVFHAVGIVAFFLLARRVFGFGPGLSLLGAALVGVAGNMALQGDHAQLFSISLLPALGLLLWRTLTQAAARRRWRAMIWACSASLLFDAWLLTSFYAAWLSALFLLILAAISVTSLLAVDWRSALRRDLFWPMVATMGVAAVGLVPFLDVYLPKASETGMHGTAEILAYRPRAVDLLNPHLMDGLMAGPCAWLEARSSHSGARDPTGYAPCLLILAGFGVLISVIGRSRSPPATARRHVAIAVPIALILVTTPTGWRIVLELVPGASGLRDIARFLLVLTAPMVLLALCGLERLAAYLAPQAILLGPLAVAALLLEETAAPMPVGLDRRAERRMLVSVPVTPSSCRSFFVTGHDRLTGGDRPPFDARHNVDAMLVSATRSLPTPNGYATFNPPDWDFEDANSPTYGMAIGRYASAHHLGGLCRLDLSVPAWDAATRLPAPVFPLDTDVSLGADDPAGSFIFLSGWEPQEPAGRWTDRLRSVLRVLLPSTIGVPLRVSLTMSALARPGAGQVDRVEARVDGLTRAVFTLDEHRRTYVLSLPPRPGSSDALSIELLQSTLRVPALIGLGVDRRHLGLFLSTLRIHAAR